MLQYMPRNFSSRPRFHRHHIFWRKMLHLVTAAKGSSLAFTHTGMQKKDTKPLKAWCARETMKKPSMCCFHEESQDHNKPCVRWDISRRKVPEIVFKRTPQATANCGTQLTEGRHEPNIIYISFWTILLRKTLVGGGGLTASFLSPRVVLVAADRKSLPAGWGRKQDKPTQIKISPQLIHWVSNPQVEKRRRSRDEIQMKKKGTEHSEELIRNENI